MAMRIHKARHQEPARAVDDPHAGTAGAERVGFGVFNKVIQVYSNSVDGRDVITVQGNSIDTPPRKIKTDKVKVKYK